MLDFEELKKDAKVLSASDQNVTEDDTGLIISEEETVDAEPDTAMANTTENNEYDGTGVVIDAPVEKTKHSANGALEIGPMANKERNDDVKKTLNEMDKEIAEQKEIADKIKANKELEKTSTEVDSGTTVEILIDKLGLSQIEFTEEEQKRIEYAKKLRVVEVDDLKLKTLNVKKKLTSAKDFNIIKKTFNKSLSPVIAIGSGYTAKMANVSAAEAIKMYQRPGPNTASSMLEKWSVIYDKLVDVSCGDFKDFEDFTERTAFTDYESFLYGMLCSSYPDKDSVEFTCNQERCGKSFSIEYANKEMIRSDLITDEQKEIMANIITSAPILSEAKKVAEQAAVNQVKRIQLDDNSGIIIDFYLPSVKEMIHRVFENLNEELSREENRSSVIMAQNIKSIYLPDYDAQDGSYYEISDLEGVVHFLNDLNGQQIGIITNMIKKFANPYIIQFGLPKVVCPHCGHNYGAYDMEVDRILFQRVQQRMMTEIE